MLRLLPLVALACLFLAAPAAAEDELPTTSQFFEEFDKNTDGTVTQDEFDGSGEVFRLLDKDKDGKITPTELGLPADYRPDPNAKKRRDAAAKKKARGGGNEKRLQRFRKLFQQMDVNKDGAVTKAEWRGNPNTFDRFDRNKDGKIDRTDVPGLMGDEMMGGDMMGGEKSGDGSPARMRPGNAEPNKTDRRAKNRAKYLERLRSMDADGDGMVSREEWKGRPAGFDRMDRDGDGQIPVPASDATPAKAAHPKISAAQAAERFTLLDKDADKSLTAEDGLPAATIQKMDADKSGGVDLAEFQEAVARAQSDRAKPAANKPDKAGKQRPGNAKMIKRFDRDLDGRVSREEFPGSDERFDGMDSDGDGYLTKADFKKPGAKKEATDKPTDTAPVDDK